MTLESNENIMGMKKSFTNSRRYLIPLEMKPITPIICRAQACNDAWRGQKILDIMIKFPLSSLKAL